ncbi:MAG: dihydrodipicolinate reductase C-terminal domain-containing protein [Planctomycetota bacterium]
MTAGVCVLGAGGRMGRFACALLARDPDFHLAAELGRADDLAAALRAARAAGAELGLDLTVAGRGCAHGRLLLESGLRPVVGTSGVTPEETSELDALAREHELGGLVVPNFSVGMWALQRAARLAAEHLPTAEIVELHHDKKRDAPSGTALQTAELLAGVTGLRTPIHSVRLPGLYAHQEVLLGGPGETLSLRHDMLGPEAFGGGILAALRYARSALGVGRGLALALEADSS